MTTATEVKAPPEPLVGQSSHLVTVILCGVVMIPFVLGQSSILPLGSIQNLTLSSLAEGPLAALIKAQAEIPGIAPKNPVAPKANGQGVKAQGVTGASLIANGTVKTTTGVGCNPAPDLASNQLYSQAIDWLVEMNQAGFTVRVSCVRSGHSRNVHNSDNISLHTVWRAFDVDQVNGQPVCARYDRNSWCLEVPTPTRQLMTWIKDRPNSQLPFEIGGPHFFPPGSRGKSAGPGRIRGGPFFTNHDHEDHLHFGFKPRDNQAPAGGWMS